MVILFAGEIVVGRRDGTWYRAEVTRMTTLSMPTFGLYFFDNGDTESVEMTNIAQIHPRVMTIPMLPIKCALHGVKRLNNDIEWDPALFKATQMIHTLTVRVIHIILLVN